MTLNLEKEPFASLTGNSAGNASGGGFPSVMMFLSLYLLLLAVFIMLNAIAQFENSRTLRAIGSVVETFRPDLEVRVRELTDDSDSGDTSRQESFIAELSTLFAARLPVAEVKELDGGNMLEVEVPLAQLFRPGLAALNPVNGALMSGMADALARRDDDLRYEVELLITGPEALPDGRAPKRSLQVQRADLFARTLRRMGVPAHAVKIGLGVDTLAQARLRFFQRAGTDVVVDFSDQTGLR